MIVVGAFPTDPIDPTDPRFVTASGWIHAMAGVLAFTCLAVSAPPVGRHVAAATGKSWLRWWSWLPVAGYLTFWACGLLDHSLGDLFDRPSATGLGERVMALTYVAWLLAVARAIRSGSSRRSPPAPFDTPLRRGADSTPA